MWLNKDEIPQSFELMPSLKVLICLAFSLRTQRFEPKKENTTHLWLSQQYPLKGQVNKQLLTRLCPLLHFWLTSLFGFRPQPPPRLHPRTEALRRSCVGSTASPHQSWPCVSERIHITNPATTMAQRQTLSIRAWSWGDLGGDQKDGSLSLCAISYCSFGYISKGWALTGVFRTDCLVLKQRCTNVSPERKKYWRQSSLVESSRGGIKKERPE